MLVARGSSRKGGMDVTNLFLRQSWKGEQERDCIVQLREYTPEQPAQHDAAAVRCTCFILKKYRTPWGRHSTSSRPQFELVGYLSTSAFGLDRWYSWQVLGKTERRRLSAPRCGSHLRGRRRYSQRSGRVRVVVDHKPQGLHISAVV